MHTVRDRWKGLGTGLVKRDQGTLGRENGERDRRDEVEEDGEGRVRRDDCLPYRV